MIGTSALVTTEDVYGEGLRNLCGSLGREKPAPLGLMYFPLRSPEYIPTAVFGVCISVLLHLSRIHIHVPFSPSPFLF